MASGQRDSLTLPQGPLPHAIAVHTAGVANDASREVSGGRARTGLRGTLEGAAALSERSEGRVLAGPFRSVQSGTADPATLRQFNRSELTLLPVLTRLFGT